MRRFVSIVFGVLVLSSVGLAQARVRCGDVEAVAREGIEYSLLQAWSPFADHSCFAGRRFKHFRPQLAHREGEVLDWNSFTWFDKKWDRYKIVSVKKDRDVYRIKVRFRIKGRPLETTYTYTPDPEYAKDNGICGFVTNPTHFIVRSDCADKAMLPPNLKL